MTRVTLVIGNPDGGSSWQIDLADDFDAVWGRVFPAQPAASALEAREREVHTAANGSRIRIRPDLIAVIEESPDE